MLYVAAADTFPTCAACHGAAAKLGVALSHRVKAAVGDGLHHVAGPSPQAVHQLHDGGQRGDQQGLQAEPVGSQEQLHPPEEHRQEAEPPLRRSESARLVAQGLPS